MFARIFAIVASFLVVSSAAAESFKGSDYRLNEMDSVMKSAMVTIDSMKVTIDKQAKAIEEQAKAIHDLKAITISQTVAKIFDLVPTLSTGLTTYTFTSVATAVGAGVQQATLAFGIFSANTDIAYRVTVTTRAAVSGTIYNTFTKPFSTNTVGHHYAAFTWATAAIPATSVRVTVKFDAIGGTFFYVGENTPITMTLMNAI